MPLARATTLFLFRKSVITTAPYSSYNPVCRFYDDKATKTNKVSVNDIFLNLSKYQHACVKSSLPKTHSLCILSYSTNGDAGTAFNFEKECEETLESLSEHFEEILEGRPPR